MHRAVPTQAESGPEGVAGRGQGPLALAFADLENSTAHTHIDPGVFRAGQIAATLRLTPFMMVGNIVAALTFAWIARAAFDPVLIGFWVAALVLPSAYLFVTSLIRRRRQVRTAGPRAMRRAELHAIILGLAWASLPALFFAAAPADLRLFIIAMLLAACGCGAFALSKLPSAGIIFTLMICAATAIAAMQMAGTIGIVFALMTLLYGIIMAASILSGHHNAVMRAADAANLNHQREIITLLLHDFERGASDWLWETDSGGRLVYFSGRMAEVLNRGRERLLGASLLQAAGVAATAAGWPALTAAMAQEETVSDHTVAVTVNGETRWWQVSAQPLRDTEGRFSGYRGVGRDITREHLARDELLHAKEEAERASAAKSQFLAVMSHELKTPLNAIIGFAEILAAGPNGQTTPEEQVDYAKTILASSTHLRSLINDILDVTRIERSSVSIIEQSGDAVELVEVAARMCRDAAAAANVEIALQHSGSAEITGDLTRLKQVIVNLIANAVKFSPHGGTVDLGICRTCDSGIDIHVLDRGIGLSPADCERVFEPFVQADEGIARKFGGLGLGLPIARKIARLHGGDVSLESRLGEGTTAHFTLPPSRVTWQEGKAKAVA